MTFATLAPDYYRDFSCTGSACPFSCCQNWSIDLSRADYTKIRSAKKSKELAATLQQGMNRKKNGDDKQYAYFTTTKQSCAMLLQNGLCALQAECGASTLPTACKFFPRLSVLSNGLLIHSCTAGCTEIMKALVLRKEPITFLQYEAVNSLKITQNTDATQHPHVPYYMQILEVCVDLLQNRAIPLRDRIIQLGIALRALEQLEQEGLQNGVDAQRFAAWKQQYSAFPTSAQDTIDFAQMGIEKSLLNNIMLTQYVCGQREDVLFNETVERVLHRFQATPLHTPPPADAADAPKKQTIDIKSNPEAYAKARAAFYEACDVDTMMENIMINYLLGYGFPLEKKGIWPAYLYFCQLYSYLHFIAVGSYTPGEEHLDSFARDLTICYRRLVHTESTTKFIFQYMEKNGCTTLAHMSVLING